MKREVNKRNVIWGYKHNKIRSFFISVDSLNDNSFKELFLNNFELGNTYSILIRGGFKSGVDYRMLGTQIGFTLNKDNYLIVVEHLYGKISDRLTEYLEHYRIDEFDTIQVLYVKVSSMSKLMLTNVNDIKMPKNMVNIKDIRRIYNHNFLPLTYNTDYFGSLITGSKCLFYTKIISDQHSIIYEDSEHKIDFDTMNLYKDKYIVLSTKLDNNTIIRNIYDAKLGVFEGKFIDYIIDTDTFKREYKFTTFTINKGKIVLMSITKELPVLNKKLNSNDPKKLAIVSNPFIGSFDLEAFEDYDGYTKVYAVGFCVLNSKPIKFYYEDNKDILLECLDTMLTKKYNGFTFYIHNLNYDGVFILNRLNVFNESNNDYYKINTLYKDSSILKIEVSIKDVKIIFVDSSNLLKGKLRVLCESFGLDVQKGNFPYKFVSRDTLFYEGITPAYDYWLNLSDDDITKDDYQKLLKMDWNLKNECLLYLEKDLLSLLELINLFNKYIYQKFGLQVTNNLTISRLSLNIYLKNYLNDSIIPSIRGSLYDDIKKSYYGGVTEVYRPYGKNLLYYDVNSLYPYAALNPMCGKSYTYMEAFENYLNLKDLFGFFYCEVETDSNYLGLLPVRRVEGLVMPNGKWSGWYFSEELKFASDNGYKINVIKGYNFTKEYNVFDKYINYLYNIKSITTNLVERATMKSLLNNLLGRFGLNINKDKTEIVSLDKLNILISTREFNSFKKISENSYLISYNSKISKSICEMHNIDYLKVLKEQDSKANLDDYSSSDKFNDVSIVISAAITAYARVYMSKVKLDILSRGGNIYYTDTDSIVTDITLSNIGNNIGEFKLEHIVKEGYFISAKTYGLVLKNGEFLCKSKGVVQKGLNIEHFINLYNGLDVKVPKLSAVRNYDKGFVSLSIKDIELNHNSYKKRVKIFNNEYKWIDTKPLTIKGDNLIENNETYKPSYTKDKKKLTIKYLRWLWCLVSNILKLFISFILVCLIGDFLGLDSDTVNVNKPHDKSVIKLDTLKHKFIDFEDLKLKYVSLFNNNNKFYHMNRVYDNVVHELLSKCVSENKFTNHDDLMRYSSVILMNEIKLGRIKTSEYFILANKINSMKYDNIELYSMLYTEYKPIQSKNVRYNIVSDEWTNNYKKWIQNPYEHSNLESIAVKNELSLMDELDKLNSNYTYLLSEYDSIKKTMDSANIPRSFNNVDSNSTNIIGINNNISLNGTSENYKT